MYVNKVKAAIVNVENKPAKNPLIGNKTYKKFLLAKKNDENNINKTCELILFLGSNHSDGLSGKLISAKWDNWKNWIKREAKSREYYIKKNRKFRNLIKERYKWKKK